MKEPIAIIGAGTGQAIEDAYVLGQLLDRGIPMESLFKQYETLRIKKAHTIVNTSWTVGKLAHTESSLGVFFRNNLMRYAPKSMSKKQMEMIFNLNY